MGTVILKALVCFDRHWPKRSTENRAMNTRAKKGFLNSLLNDLQVYHKTSPCTKIEIVSGIIVLPMNSSSLNVHHREIMFCPVMIHIKLTGLLEFSSGILLLTHSQKTQPQKIMGL